MKVIIGSYRGPELVARCMKSIWANVSGISKIVIVDDSGNDEWADSYRNDYDWPDVNLDVISLPKLGYNVAMNTVCQNASGHRFLFVEEDFTFKSPVDLDWMEKILIEAPWLAQLALLRGPHFDNEKLFAAAPHIGDEGAVLAGLQARLPNTVIDKREVLGQEIIVQDGTFTCNPAVWQTGISSAGWPEGRWSEDRMRDMLLAKNYIFGFLPGIRVEHDGVRSGFGY